MAIFQARHYALRRLGFGGDGELLEMPWIGSRLKAGFVVKIFVAGSQGKPDNPLEASSTCEAAPMSSAAARECVSSVVVIDIGTELVRRCQQQGGVIEISPALIGASVLRAGNVVIGPSDFLGIHIADKNQSFAAVVVFGVIPTVDDLNTAREMAADRQNCAD